MQVEQARAGQPSVVGQGGSKARRELCGQNRSTEWLESAPPVHKPREHGILVLAQRRLECGHSGRAAAQIAGWRCAGADILSHDDRPRHEIPEPAPSLREEQARQPDEVEHPGLHVEHADEIAHRRHAERHRVAALAHDTKTMQALARRLPVHQSLKEHVIAPEDDELREDEEGRPPTRREVGREREMSAEHHHRDGDGEEQPDADQEIRESGQHARANARQRVGQHDQLGRLDIDGLLEWACGHK